jgi:endonuclease/exonuclease/phosphatase family metal-dependent hydrolase
VISRFDIVALQEVESLVGLEALRVAVSRLTEVPWKAIVSEKVGQGQAAEYYAFLYRTDRVQEAVGIEGCYPEISSTDFSREPFFATFIAGNFDFTLITVHITWGSYAAERTAEVMRLATVWDYVQQRDPFEDDILLMGDFNRDKPTNSAFNALRTLGVTPLITGSDVFTTYSTKPDQVGASWYDNIWMDPTYTSCEYTGTSGVDYTYKHYYQDSATPHLEVRKKISDHCPVWAGFRTDLDDDDASGSVGIVAPSATPASAARIVALETQVRKLSDTIDDLRDDIRDLEDEVEDLQDRVEELEN